MFLQRSNLLYQTLDETAPDSAASSGTSFHGQVMALSPAAYFRLNRKNLQLIDSEVNGWTGTWTGAAVPEYGIPGPVAGDQTSRNVRFNSTPGQYLITNYFPPTGTNARTHMGIFRSLSAASSGGFICYGSAASPLTNPGERVNCGWSLGRMRFICNPYQIRSNAMICDGNWHIGFWVWPSAADAPDELKMYLDGHRVTSFAATSSSTIGTVAGLPLTIGGHGDLAVTGYNTVDGNVAEVAVWESELTAAQIYRLSRTFFKRFRMEARGRGR